MGFNFNETKVNTANYNGKELEEVYYNNVKVFGKEAPIIEDINKNWEYTEDDSSISLIKYIGTSNSVNIPSVYNSKNITLTTNAFQNANETSKNNLVSVTMNKKLNIENNSIDSMFSNYSSLESVHDIPDNVTSMNSTFSDCTNLYQIPNIPSSVTELNSTFTNCNIVQIKSTDIPNTITTLYNTFSNCSLLEYISIPDSIKNIDNAFRESGIKVLDKLGSNIINMNRAFYNCKNLYSICDIPDSVTNMIYTFSECTNLVSVNKLGGNNTINAYGIFRNCSNLVTVNSISNSIINLSFAFSNCYNMINSPTIPNGVDNMYATYYGCTNISKIPPIPDSVHNLSFAFGACNNISSLVLSNNVTDLNYAFINSNIPNISIFNPSDNPCIMNNAFAGSKCNMFYIGTRNSVTFYENAMEFYGNATNVLIQPEGFNINNWSHSSSLGTEVLTSYTGNDEYVFIPRVYNRTNIMLTTNNSFRDRTKVDTVRIYCNKYSSSNMHSIFAGCTNLTTVYGIPNNVTIMDNAFRSTNIRSLDEIPNTVTSMINTFMDSNLVSCPNIPDSVTNIANAFKNCKLLESISSFGNNIKNMDNAFNGCYNLSEVPDLNNTKITTMNNSFMNCTNLIKTPNLPSTLTSIYSTFAGCTNLTTVSDIPSNVTNMAYAFNKCSNISGRININSLSVRNTSYTFSSGKDKYIFCNGLVYNTLNTTWNNKNNCYVYSDDLFNPNMFNNTEYTDTSIVLGDYNTSQNYTNIIIPTVYCGKEIDMNKFSFKNANKIKSIEFSKELSFTNIYNTFYGCTNLVNITNLPDNLTNITKAFYNCPNLTTNINIPDNVKNLDYTFYNCINMPQAPVLPNSISSMVYSFYNCAKITSIGSLPNNVSTIRGAFSHCSSLTEAPIIPDSVKDMSYSFCNCVKFTSTPTIGNSVTNTAYAFSNCRNLTEITNVPSSVIDVGGLYSGCKNITNGDINLPSGVTNIDYLYQGTGLTCIPNIVGDNIKYMVGTFSNCYNLNAKCQYLLPNTVEYIQYLFSNCTSLETSPIIPKNVTDMYHTFDGCTSLKGDIAVFSKETSMYNTFINTNNSLRKDVYCTGNAFAGGMKTIGECNAHLNSLFVESDFTITVENGNKYVSNYNGTHEFAYIPAVANGYNIYLNGVNCFRYNNNISVIEIEPGVNVTNMHKMCDGCANLTAISDIPDSVTNLDYGLYGCKNLVKAPKIGNGVTNLIGTFMFCTNLTCAPTLHNSIINMYRAFCNCSSLEVAPEIPDSVTVLYDAFWYCANLTCVPKIGNNVKDLSGAFSCCFELENLPVIPSSVTNMRGTFSGTNKFTTAPEIPANVTNMHTTFNGCSKLTGDINIQSPNVTNVTACFGNTSLAKTVYTKSGSTTYSTFRSSYGSLQNGVTIKTF